MNCWLFLLPTFLFIFSAQAQGECIDIRGRLVAHGMHYVPGPDTCKLCVCDSGLPKICKAVLCSQPQECRSFRVGNNCCEYICLDDVVKPAEGSEANVRVAAGGAALVVLLTVALIVYRVRKQKRRRTPNVDEGSLTSIGYISGSMGYIGGSCETALAAWKPHGHYLPRGEAPPPYDEAVAQCRPDHRLLVEQNYHRSYPATVETLVRAEDSMQCSGHGYINVSRPMLQVTNPQGCYNAPMLQAIHSQDMRENVMSHHPLIPGAPAGFGNAVRLTGSLGAISGRALLHARVDAPSTAMHRTIPRISGAIESSMDNGPFCRVDRLVHPDVRRSFHRPPERRDTARSMRNLSDTTSTLRVMSGDRSQSCSEEQHVEAEVLPAPAPRLPGPGPSNCGPAAGVPAPALPTPAATLPLTADKPSCGCSYEGTGAPNEEVDDYRSECENCKAAASSKWAVEAAAPWQSAGGTQTLERRAPPPAPPPVATATLPQPVTKPRNLAQPSNWENWFNTIADSDTESEDD